MIRFDNLLVALQRLAQKGVRVLLHHVDLVLLVLSRGQPVEPRILLAHILKQLRECCLHVGFDGWFLCHFSGLIYSVFVFPSRLLVQLRTFVPQSTMKVSVASAKNNLAKLIRRAEAGEVVTIERHGKAVVQLCQLPPELRPQKDDTLDDDAFNELLSPAYLRNILRS